MIRCKGDKLERHKTTPNILRRMKMQFFLLSGRCLPEQAERVGETETVGGIKLDPYVAHTHTQDWRLRLSCRCDLFSNDGFVSVRRTCGVI